MRDAITAAVRTAVQGAVTAGLLWLASKGIDLDEPAVQALAASLALGVVTLGLNRLQEKFPWIGTVLSVGLSKETPTY